MLCSSDEAGVINLLEDKKRAARANFKRTHYETWTAIHYAWAYMTNPLNYTQGGRKVARKSNFLAEIFRRESRYFEGNLGRA